MDLARSLLRLSAVASLLAAVACSAQSDEEAASSEQNATAGCATVAVAADSGLWLRKEPRIAEETKDGLLARGTRVTVIDDESNAKWSQVRTAEGRVGWLHKDYITCVTGGAGPTTPTQPPPAASGRAGADFTPQACDDCMRVAGGEIRYKDGTRFVALGANLPGLRDGNFTGTDWNELRFRNVKVVRMFAAGGNMQSADPASDWQEEWSNRVVARVNEAWQNGFRVIVSFADYYHGLPGESLTGDNAAMAEWCNMQVRPWPWYRKGTERFDFDSACEGKTLRSAPNYEVFYKPFAMKIVGKLAQNPGVFAWSIGNELRALGRGGRGSYGVTQGQAIDTFASFLEDMIASIRAVDRNHLVIPGVQNMTEVSDDQAGGSTWSAGLDRMMRVPFNVWNITMYNDNANARADIGAFRSRGVPVIATEYDFWSPMCQSEGGDKMGDRACAVMKEGLSMVAPWARTEMQSVCSNTAQAWDSWGYLGGTRMQSECR